MPKTFSVIVPGDPPTPPENVVLPRAFRWDMETKTLSTDSVDGGGGDADMYRKPGQDQLIITEETHQQNPDYIRFWKATATHRIAFELCESEGMSMDEALVMAENMSENGAPPIAPSAPENPSYNEIGERISAFNPNVEPEAVTAPVEPETNPIAGIVITNQQLILSMAFKLLEQYVPEDDPNSGMVELLKAKVEELDGYEIVI